MWAGEGPDWDEHEWDGGCGRGSSDGNLSAEALAIACFIEDVDGLPTSIPRNEVLDHHHQHHHHLASMDTRPASAPPRSVRPEPRSAIELLLVSVMEARAAGFEKPSNAACPRLAEGQSDETKRSLA
ncbi:hypothetical protein CCHR01_12733 [Colletotrichum chrysophilum]|uniref:Uncharacterized protein n=1 Tax=Colletotrichum chrysophilum TaxID=1836956 RepID=A0AAD9EDU8_9PEZI|nr:hypothetical protein CCHR01_12733 [Colletotrichum chrysophilum]